MVSTRTPDGYMAGSAEEHSIRGETTIGQSQDPHQAKTSKRRQGGL